MKVALAQTEKNLVKKSSKKNVNECIFEILFEKKPKSKNEIVTEIALERLQKIHIELTAEQFATEEIQKEFNSIYVTCKNGFEASICKGHTNASFNYNPLYEKYTFQKTNNGNFEVVTK